MLGTAVIAVTMSGLALLRGPAVFLSWFRRYYILEREKGPLLVAGMPNATHGLLIECEVPIKQFILHVDQETRVKSPAAQFVLADLDDSHVLVKPNSVGLVQQKLSEMMDSNAFIARREERGEKGSVEEA